METLINQYGEQTLVLVAVASIGYYIFIWRPKKRQMKIVSLQNQAVILWRNGATDNQRDVITILAKLDKLGVKPAVTFASPSQHVESQNG